MRSWRSIASAVVLFATANGCGSGTISGGDDTPVAGLRFVTQPSASGAAGSTFSVSVELLNASGQKIGNADDPVTLTVNGGADLLGTLTQAAVNGVATFSGLSVTRAGTGFTISASSNGITASSSSFTITPAAANGTQSSATYTPSTITTGATIAVVLTFKDQYGNPVPNKTVTLSSNLAGITFTPSTGTTSATGTFTTNMVATAAGSATVSATVDGVSISLPAAVTITAPTTFTITTSSNPSTGGSTTGGGTVAQGASVTVVATPATGFTFTNWTEGSTAVSTSASYTFTATANRTLVANFTATSGGNCTPAAMTFPGTTTGSVSSAGCVVSGSPAAVYRFTATGGVAQTFALTSTGFTGPRLEIMTDPPESHVSWVGTASGTTVSSEYLLPAGTYQARVSSTSNGSGTFSLVGGTTALNNTTCNTRTLLVTVTVTQALSATDCPWQDPVDGTVFDRFAIASSSTKGCTVRMTATGFRAYLEARDASTNAVLAQVAGSGTPSVATITSTTGCRNGSNAIFILANSFDVTGAAGTYTLEFIVTGGGSLVDGSSNTRPYDSPWLTIDATHVNSFGPSGVGKASFRR